MKKNTTLLVTMSAAFLVLASSTYANMAPETLKNTTSSSTAHSLKNNKTSAHYKTLTDVAHTLAVFNTLQQYDVQRNVVFSPVSIEQMILGLSYARTQHTPPKPSQGANKSEAFAQSSLLMAARLSAATTTQQGSQSFHSLTFYNNLWYSANKSLQPDFKKSYQMQLAGNVTPLAFDKPKQATIEINQQIAKQTNNRFNQIVTQDDVSRAVVVFSNSVYFKSGWQYPFKTKKTHDADFKNANGTTVTVPMMTKIQHYPFAQTNGWTLVRIPFADKQSLLDLYLPPDNTPLATPNVSIVHELQAMASQNKLRLSLPRIDQSSDRIDIKAVFPSVKHWELDRLFTSSTPQKIHAFHQANIRWDEQGAEAAAATVAIGTRSLAVNIPKVRFDRPFFYTVTAKKHVLFAGSVRAL